MSKLVDTTKGNQRFNWWLARNQMQFVMGEDFNQIQGHGFRSAINYYNAEATARNAKETDSKKKWQMVDISEVSSDGYLDINEGAGGLFASAPVDIAFTEMTKFAWGEGSSNITQDDLLKGAGDLAFKEPIFY